MISMRKTCIEKGAAQEDLVSVPELMFSDSL